MARANWRTEFEKFSSEARPCNVVYSGDDAHKLGGGIVICSYEGLPDVINNYSGNFDCVIIDESHYIKEPNAARTRNVLGKTGAIHRGKAAYLLTGTPTPNHAGELWTTIYTLGATELSYDRFIERYCTYRLTSFGRQITGTTLEPDKITELRRMCANICLRRTKEDVGLNFPILYSDVVVKPGKVELIMCQSFQKYVVPVDRTEDLVRDIERELGVVKGIVNGGFTAQAMLALEANAKNIMTLRRYNSMQKVEPVVELVSGELDSGAYSKIVIFAIHRDTVVSLQEKLGKKYGAVLIFGGTKPSRIEDRINKFQTSKMCKVMVAQLHAAGTSLTLTASDQVLFVDMDWVPGNNAQAAARCARIGQKRHVTARCVSIDQSIDQHITNILTRKTQEIKILTDGAFSSGQNENRTINDLL